MRPDALRIGKDHLLFVAMKHLTFGHWASDATHHAAWEDLLGIMIGTILVALSLSIYAHLGMVTGGVAGLALIGHYWSGIAIGTLFFFINLPFYVLAIMRMGKAFTIKTFLAVAALSLLMNVQDRLLSFANLDLVAGSVLAGVLLGMGLLAMFRHRTSLGGVGILALYLQDRFQMKAGLVQMVIDLAILLTSFLVADPILIAFSVLSAVILNMIITINHRQDRYIAR